MKLCVDKCSRAQAILSPFSSFFWSFTAYYIFVSQGI